MIVTFSDVLDHVLDYSGSDAAVSAAVRHRRAVQNAYTLLPTLHNWSYLRGVCRVTTNEPYETGTIEYDYTGGAYENMVTLTDGTWPTWIASGYLVIDNVPYRVLRRVSDTIITLVAQSAPVEDIAAATEYQALQDQYALPSDFVAGDEATVNEIGTVLQYMHPRDWSSQRRVNSGPGQPLMHTYLGNTTVRGGLVVAIWPPADAAYVIDILYKRSMRPLIHSSVDDGSVSATSGSTTITGDGTAFKSGMVGSIIRFAAQGDTAKPTGQTGDSPAAVERTIVTYTSASSIEVDEEMPETLAAVPYEISDPIDIEVTSMNEFFLRLCEMQWRLIARSKPTPEEPGAYERALVQAREADNRDYSRAAAGRGQTRRSGFDHYPMDWST